MHSEMLHPTGTGTRRGGSADRVIERHFVPAARTPLGSREKVALPVHRIIANDAERARYSPDPTSRAVMPRADRLPAGSDGGSAVPIAAWRRTRPAWDVAGLAGSATGTYLAARRMPTSSCCCG
jgi:hypothetical protein